MRIAAENMMDIIYATMSGASCRRIRNERIDCRWRRHDIMDSTDARFKKNEEPLMSPTYLYMEEVRWHGASPM